MSAVFMAVTVVVALSSLSGQNWVPSSESLCDSLKREKQKLFHSCLTCILLFQEWMEAIKKFCGKVMNTTVGERDVKQLRSLEVNVVEAHSSNKVSHPYCMISLNEVKTCRTKTQEGHSPIWNEEFKFKWVNWFWIWPHTFAFLCSSITVESRHNGHLVERFKQESMCGLSAKKVAASESSIVLHSLS